MLQKILYLLQICHLQLFLLWGGATDILKVTQETVVPKTYYFNK
ncbi:MAG: hypothetical protein G01um101448_195 [Parcubacteria group bacterium Gr01-1014_48]|nr:MAG: hypothetical protein Greene041614_946 [Parcubacteria group bacterium Greene0416_14]TSC74319.1 MAG: hypothetical protein G01um101448_195 [Parcubacteria group bacterium Gr01-1014_48]TSD01019.1 MAG: hypothetical protein Greene101415_520 [Parcubacteria group bacterium Greene1014_15]TSD07676.1 MAG: hypothetical protein Greene07144_830 [Parcubacteria group bacterium Greene0714_4]